MQRYRCTRCAKTFSEKQPLQGLRIEPEKVAQCTHLLVEGVGIRACERLTGLSRETVLNVLKVAGEQCARIMDEKIENLNCKRVAADEMYAFVYCLQKHVDPLFKDEHGAFYTFLSTDPESKLVINSLVGKRTKESADDFLMDLKARVPNRFQLTTDAWNIYAEPNGAVRRIFGNTVDYATETKVFSKNGPFEKRRVSKIIRREKIGNPDLNLATTCHLERTNLSVRIFNRRHTRCTLGYSKTLDNLKHSVAMFLAHFNFCRAHASLKVKATETEQAKEQTPAMAAGLTDHVWTVQELLAAK